MEQENNKSHQYLISGPVRATASQVQRKASNALEIHNGAGSRMSEEGDA